jgi:hypothetical protein
MFLTLPSPQRGEGKGEGVRNLIFGGENMLINRNSKAQTAFEYALLITVLIAAFLVMRTFYTRAQQGRARVAADRIGTQFDPSEGYSYDWSKHSDGTTKTVEESGAEQAGGARTTIESAETINTDTDTETWGDNFGTP